MLWFCQHLAIWRRHFEIESDVLRSFPFPQGLTSRPLSLRLPRRFPAPYAPSLLRTSTSTDPLSLWPVFRWRRVEILLHLLCQVSQTPVTFGGHRERLLMDNTSCQYRLGIYNYQKTDFILQYYFTWISIYYDHSQQQICRVGDKWMPGDGKTVDRYLGLSSSQYQDADTSTKVPYKDACSDVDVFEDHQKEMCSKTRNVLGIVSRGAATAIDECQFQFKNRRWNCTTFQDQKTVFGNVLSVSKYRPI